MFGIARVEELLDVELVINVYDCTPFAKDLIVLNVVFGAIHSKAIFDLVRPRLELMQLTETLRDDAKLGYD